MVAKGSRQYSLQLMRLEEMLSGHPEYCTNSFGSQLVGSFFSRFSELESYCNLKKRGLIPEIDPLIMPGNKNSTKADFKIRVNCEEIFIKVVTPRAPLEDELDDQNSAKAGFGESTPDRIYKSLFTEYKHHFKLFEPQFSSPTIIILDKTYANDLSDLFGVVNLGHGLYQKYQFPAYFVGVLDLTRYQIDLLLENSNQQKPSRFYINPRFKDKTSLIPALTQLFSSI